MEKWRLLVHGSFDAPANMAIDEVLLNSAMPVFRLYSWQPASFSLGRFQDPAKVLIKDVPFVRRMTGGGAIYHDTEITYSLVCEQQTHKDSSLKDGYRKLSAFLLAAYRKMGLDARFACETGGQVEGTIFGAPSGYCFSGREEFDIVIDEKKIGGNAQRIVKKRVFQHGSIPLHIIRGNYLPFLINPSHQHDYTALSELLGVLPESGQIAEILIESFSECMGVRFEPSELSPEEWKEAERLIAEKYSHPVWNYPGTKMRAEVL